MSEHSSTQGANPRRKIALCLEYPIDLQGGVSVLCAVLARHFSSRYDIVLVSPDTEATLKNSPHRTSFKSLVHWESKAVSKTTAKQLAKALAQSGVELAHFHYGGTFGFGNRFVGTSPVFYTAQGGIAVCSTAHLVVGALEGYCGPEKPGWFKLAMWPFTWAGKMQTLAHLRREITVSRWGETRLRRRFLPFRNRFQTIYHSRISSSEFSATPPQKEKIVLSVGHVAVRKGQAVLVDAFAEIAGRHPDWKLLVLGGVNEPQCEQQILSTISRRQLQGRIEMLGARADALDFTRTAAVFVQPSFFEGLPLALQEAMLMGCACVGTEIPGNTEIIDHRVNGLLVPPGDVRRMSEALDALLTDETLRAKFQAVARKSVLDRGMSAEQMIEAHARLYENLLLPR